MWRNLYNIDGHQFGNFGKIIRHHVSRVVQQKYSKGRNYGGPNNTGKKLDWIVGNLTTITGPQSVRIKKKLKKRILKTFLKRKS